MRTMMKRSTRRKAGRRDFGTIKNDGTPTNPRFSAVWWEGRRQRRRRGFKTRGDAASHLARVRVELESGARQIGDPVVVDGVTVEGAISAYEKHLDEKGCKAGGNAERIRRLRQFFADTALLLSDLTTAKGTELYTALRTSVSPVTKKVYAVDTHRNVLAEARMLAAFAVTKRWLKTNPLEAVEGVGKRRHGKAQLRLDETRKWMAKAIELAAQGDAGAVAAMMTLLLGMRASEITTRVVRDLDDDGKLLWIPSSKTEAGRRRLQVPDVLRPYLQRIADGKKPEAPLFGAHWRDWPRENVQRICKLADVPKVNAHGMRGLHTTLAMAAGITGPVVAAAVGHESPSTTVQSYATPEAVAGAQQRRALTVLIGGKAEPMHAAFDPPAHGSVI